MKISITLQEAMNKGIWLEFCHMFGWDEYCINEGADPNIEQEMTQEQASELGIL